MTLFSISDLHIRDAHDPAYARFLTWLDWAGSFAEAHIVLNGDIFEFFTADRNELIQKFTDFFSRVQDLSARGARIYWLEGNHDFNLDHLQKMMPVQIYGLGNSIEITVDGKRFFIGHGDLVNEKDYGYRLLHAFFRTGFFRFCVRTAPWWLVALIAKPLMQNSQQKRKGELIYFDEGIQRMFRKYAEKKWRAGFDVVLMGHNHTMDLYSDTAGHAYANVGYPKQTGKFIQWTKSQGLRLEPFSFA